MTLLVVTLSTYFGIAYAFAFSRAAASPRTGIDLAILAMDGLIALQFVRNRPNFRVAARHGSGSGRWFGWLSAAGAYAALICVALIHADYVLARYRGAEEGLTGPLTALKVWLLAAQLLCVLFLALSNPGAGRPGFGRRAFRTHAPDLVLFSLALIPLANYVAHNGQLFTIFSAAEYLAFFVVCALAGFAFVLMFQRLLNAAPIAAPVSAALAFVYYSMPIVSAALRRPIEALFPVHAALATVVPAAIALCYWLNRTSTRRAAAAISVCSIAGSVVQFGFAGAEVRSDPILLSENVASTGASPLDGLLAGPVQRTPDVYLLVYDGYAAPMMMRRYGIDDGATREFLDGKGFRVYEDAYSLFLSSRPSMAAVLDMRADPQAEIRGNSTAIKFFERNGYETHLILNSYLLQGASPIAADFVFPPWRHRSALDALYRGIAGGEFKSEIVFQDSPRAEWLAAKRSVLARRHTRPTMVYAHSGFPGHSQNSGDCLPDETEQYAARLAVATREMRDDVETILGADPGAIIIVAGDHGPYLTGDCLYMTRNSASELTATHLADRYGILLGVRWPSAVPERFDRTAVLQDVFFSVSAYLLEDDRVWRYRAPGRTIGYGGIPTGAVRDGIVRVGRNAGDRLLK